MANVTTIFSIVTAHAIYHKLFTPFVNAKLVIIF